MKNILLGLGLIISVPSFAQSVMVNPVVLNFGNSIQVQVTNTTDSLINCTGSIMMNTQLGRTETAYYADYIQKGSMSYRMFYLTNFSDRVTYTSQFITCSKAQ